MGWDALWPLCLCFADELQRHRLNLDIIGHVELQLPAKEGARGVAPPRHQRRQGQLYLSPRGSCRAPLAGQPPIPNPSASSSVAAPPSVWVTLSTTVRLVVMVRRLEQSVESPPYSRMEERTKPGRLPRAVAGAWLCSNDDCGNFAGCLGRSLHEMLSP